MKTILFLILCVQFIFATPEKLAKVEKLMPDKEFTKYQFGQISSVDVDDFGNVYIFHRGSNTWLADSFNIENKYLKASNGNITEATLVVLDGNGNLITETGRNMFLMPHGLTVDYDNNIWLTDVALHQVFKFKPIDLLKKLGDLGAPLLTLGEYLVPGNDNHHFCKPTSVAVDSKSGDFFVADGYCNSRIMKFDKNGKFLVSWGKVTILKNFQSLGPFNLNVPHSLTINQKENQLIVADREDSRVMIYSFDGQYISGIHIGSRVYAVSYSPLTECIYGVTGDTYPLAGSGFIFSLKLGVRTAEFSPPDNFKNAHDVAISHDGQHIYVVELMPYTVWKFSLGSNENAGVSQETMKSVVPVDEEDLIKPDAGPSLGANQLAITIVTVIVLLAIFATGCHMYRKREKTSSIEMRGLILSDEE